MFTTENPSATYEFDHGISEAFDLLNDAVANRNVPPLLPQSLSIRHVVFGEALLAAIFPIS